MAAKSARTVDIRKDQPQLADVLRLVLAGDEVIIVEGDKPLARCIPVAPPRAARVPGLNSGAIWVSDDFDEPLPDDFWPGREPAR